MSSILAFCEKYEEKLKNDKLIVENSKLEGYSITDDYIDRISFSVSYREYCPRIFRMYLGGGQLTTIDLDDDDLKYLYEKYSKKLADEMNERVLNITKQYDRN